MLEIGGRFLLGLPALCTPQSQVRVLNKLAVSTLLGVICSFVMQLSMFPTLSMCLS